jgi:CheY-like chemotaxis protein
VNADRASLEQVVLNLAVNARDAMPEGGTIRFSTGFVSDSAGSRARLEVRDTGGGMDDESRRRIFEPFYTTKQGGTGLGLSTVQDIVERIRGEVRVDSQLGVGTRFVIELPIAEVLSPKATRPADPAEVPVRVGRLLLVEDDDMVRKSTRRILERSGYRVSSAIDGRDALLFLQADGAIDVIVTDLNMPRLGGLQLALELESLGFEIPVIFVSGRVEAPPDAPDSFRFRTSFIQKPFYPADLLRAVADCLDDGDDGLRMSGSVDSKSRVL